MIERLSTHVLDTTLGRPAGGIPVTLERSGTGAVDDLLVQGPLGSGTTDADGRVAQLNDEPLAAGEYRLLFATADYFDGAHGAVFYPRIVVHVQLGEREHVHIALLTSTFSYATYLGS